MDNKLEILLGSEKNVNSVNADNYTKIELTRDTSEINEFTVNDVVNATEVFDEERQETPIYRIYGSIEYLSLLNGLINDQSNDDNNYKVLEDFFTPVYSGASKSIMNSFSFYLVKPSETGKEITFSDDYVRYFEVIATPAEFELYHAGFSNNVYGEQGYAFNFKTDFDVSPYFDKHGLPITELFLYAQYNLKTNGNGVSETMEYTYWSSYGVIDKRSFTPQTLNIGDRVETATNAPFGDLLNYNKEEFSETEVSGQTVYIKTQYERDNGDPYFLIWKFNPLIPFKLRYLSDELYTKEIIRLPENSTTLEVGIGSSSTGKLFATKSIPQTLNATAKIIEDWNPYSTSLLDWDEDDGYVTFQVSGTYTIKFQTQVHFTQNSYKYFGKTWLEEHTGGGWVVIPGTTREYQVSDEPQTVEVVRSYGYGDNLRTKTQLILNPAPIVPEETDVPYYATQLTTGNYVWREIVEQGYTEPLTGNGVDYPFFNGRRYLFAPIILSVSPDLDDLDNGYNTRNQFSNISFDGSTTLNIVPAEGDLDNIGKPCQ